jgi:hypothetical protein
MVCAVIEGRKTQTRRVVKPQPSEHHWSAIPGYQQRVTEKCRMVDGRLGIRFAHSIPQNREWDWDDWTVCPYGAPGDRLYVREAYKFDDPFNHLPPRDVPVGSTVFYLADNGYAPAAARYRHARFMPRWASRISLEVTGVRVERLMDIGDADAQAEGWPGPDQRNSIQSAYPIAWYSCLWEEINGAGSWAANPWVWVVEFKRVKP